MSIEVTPDVFDFFKSRIGSDVGEHSEIGDLRDWMSTDLEFLNVVKIPYPINMDDWSDDLLENWDNLNNWWNPIICYDDYDCDDPYDKPSRIFGDKHSVIRYLVQFLANDDANDNCVGYVKLTCVGRNLFLIYTDFDSWTLSSGNYVDVVGSLDEVSDRLGFYKCI